jgi:hypothetical protein
MKQRFPSHEHKLTGKRVGRSAVRGPFSVKLDLDRTFDRLTSGTVAVLSLIILLLLLALILHSRLESVTDDNSQELLAEVEELQETTEDLQDALDTISGLPGDNEEVSTELGDIEQRLDEIDETLETIEDNIVEIAPVDDSPETDGTLPSTQEIEDIRQGIGQVFLLVAYLIGGLSMVTALVLLVAVASRPKRRRFSVSGADDHPRL